MAHPEWPYTGTPHAWRGFAEAKHQWRRVNADPIEYAIVQGPNGDGFVKVDGKCVSRAVYQKQNFGPELD